MCGRYASARKRIELLEEFGVQRDRVSEPLEPDYNVAPTKPVYAVLTRRDDEHGRAERELRVVRWGLVPFWAKDISIGSRMINARAETVADKPAFRRAFARRRCLLPADGYYEWQRLDQAAAPGQVVGDSGPQRVAAGGGTAGKGAGKQPYFIHRADGRPLAFAGLYELWRDREVPEDDPAAWLWTATIITTSAPDELGRIHDRMPMIIDPGSWPDWLDPEVTDPAQLRPLLAPAISGLLESYPVSTAVNSVRHNGPELIEPAAAATGQHGQLAALCRAGGAVTTTATSGSDGNALR
ncbi:MAG: SOS response-associated peptidase [Streptosporangiaceae bacterium]